MTHLCTLLDIGETASITKTFTEKDLELFAQVSLDNNPVHFDATYASRTQFRNKVVHGMCVASLISAVLGTRLPGAGTIYLGQTLNFRAPVFIGDTIEAKVTIAEILEKNRYKLTTTCTNQKGQCVLDGNALILFEQVI